MLCSIRYCYFDSHIAKFPDIFSYAINPARDLGPRLMIALCGWGVEAFSAHNWWWWIPVVWCHVGGILGVIIHWAVIEHGDQEDTNVKSDREKEENQVQLTIED